MSFVFVSNVPKKPQQKIKFLNLIIDQIITVFKVLYDILDPLIGFQSWINLRSREEVLLRQVIILEILINGSAVVE
jgi:hypothetical protein